MRTNIHTQLQRQIGSNSERGNGTQMFRAMYSLVSLSIESLTQIVWCVPCGINPQSRTADSTADFQGFAGFVTKSLGLASEVDAPRHVPSLGTDQAFRSGLIAS